MFCCHSGTLKAANEADIFEKSSTICSDVSRILKLIAFLQSSHHVRSMRPDKNNIGYANVLWIAVLEVTQNVKQLRTPVVVNAVILVWKFSNNWNWKLEFIWVNWCLQQRYRNFSVAWSHDNSGVPTLKLYCL